MERQENTEIRDISICKRRRTKLQTVGSREKGGLREIKMFTGSQEWLNVHLTLLYT